MWKLRLTRQSMKAPAKQSKGLHSAQRLARSCKVVCKYVVILFWSGKSLTTLCVLSGERCIPCYCCGLYCHSFIDTQHAVRLFWSLLRSSFNRNPLTWSQAQKEGRKELGEMIDVLIKSKRKKEGRVLAWMFPQPLFARAESHRYTNVATTTALTIKPHESKILTQTQIRLIWHSFEVGKPKGSCGGVKLLPLVVHTWSSSCLKARHYKWLMALRGRMGIYSSERVDWGETSDNWNAAWDALAPLPTKDTIRLSCFSK